MYVLSGGLKFNIQSRSKAIIFLLNRYIMPLAKYKNE